ncbi:entry exclusion lipoprotein TrbK [Legionella geestiana]|uniref:entry exclusion lipoprotein TrbK n=1 Tax=Legionella geestiana TaxID=45065 RepID=UPI00048A4FBB|nr:entry exclusion lipoprotein TrbK [Legionella geestiana]QBS13498.1 entry exclusion lipoprotein TrbK [Legionella geestiana]STX59158.1 Uncharacterised protein [Legionella geestiana]STX59224.1 Uncharacterised protein [Legionella geestiana]
MKTALILCLILTGALAGCDSSKPSGRPLTCADSPQGRSKAEQMEIGEACFRGGSFKKSSNREW